MCVTCMCIFYNYNACRHASYARVKCMCRPLSLQFCEEVPLAAMCLLFKVMPTSNFGNQTPKCTITQAKWQPFRQQQMRQANAQAIVCLFNIARALSPANALPANWSRHYPMQPTRHGLQTALGSHHCGAGRLDTHRAHHCAHQLRDKTLRLGLGCGLTRRAQLKQ